MSLFLICKQLPLLIRYQPPMHSSLASFHLEVSLSWHTHLISNKDSTRIRLHYYHTDEKTGNASYNDGVGQLNQGNNWFSPNGEGMESVN